MSHKPFSPELKNRIKRGLDQIAEAYAKSSERPLAAFDADGTLWDCDIGENFFDHLITQARLASMPEDPWHYYATGKELGHTPTFYRWLADILAGRPLTEVQSWAREALAPLTPLPVFADIRELIEELRQREFQVCIVTASVKWAVEPAAEELGFATTEVLGIENKVHLGKVSLEPLGSLTWREGKLARFQEVFAKRSPDFAVGNTMGDFFLLEGARSLALAVGAAKRGEELFETEEALRKEAIERGWLHHCF